jgi:hypothetical protein
LCENFAYPAHPTYGIEEVKAKFMIYFKISSIEPLTDDFVLFDTHIKTNTAIIGFMKKKSDGKFYALESKDDDKDKTTNTIYTVSGKTYYIGEYVTDFSNPPIDSSEELEGCWRFNNRHYQAIHTNNTNVNDTSIRLDNVYICGKGGFNFNYTIREACLTDYNWVLIEDTSTVPSIPSLLNRNIEERARNQRIRSRNIENIWGNTLSDYVNDDAQSWWNEAAKTEPGIEWNKYRALRSACKKAAEKENGEGNIRGQVFGTQNILYWEGRKASDFDNRKDLNGNWDEY